MNSVANLGHNWLTAFEQLPALLIGLQYTAIVSICSFLAALAVGLLVALVRLSSIHWIRNVAFFYIQVFRSLSVYVYILFIYFGIAAFMNVDLDPIGAAIIALTLLNSAYIAEIFRSAIQAIDPGQREAALCLGMSGTKAFQVVLLPQAFRLALPALVNQLTVIIKDSSIVGVIGVADTTYEAAQVANVTYLQFEMFTVVGAIYIAVVLTLSHFAGYLERHLRIS
ncbi:amino acid ABC transporter permease [Caballeronia sordidicola]|jgi:His/Glu/Gln/Arg/opine family amino acid ABC transporter permease subunit|uniref:Amino acid ABC transporter, permease protein n=1 Tax=Caballeronia sordidicola TaxID=196367 RepID=A0A226XAG2_CABSO|nr:amino acid ABC transporter permease [Caballeronia sordidicola]OXC80089.1 Amino acid ABC transporter, permease protein [Caballeronia sordidicola]